MTLEFRTFYPRGLILYVANTNQDEYVAIEMVRGKVRVSYEGKNLGNEMEMDGSLDDGLWHYVSCERAWMINVFDRNDNRVVLA